MTWTKKPAKFIYDKRLTDTRGDSAQIVPGKYLSGILHSGLESGTLIYMISFAKHFIAHHDRQPDRHEPQLQVTELSARSIHLRQR